MSDKPMPDVKAGSIIYFGNAVPAVVRVVFEKQGDEPEIPGYAFSEAVLSAVIDSSNPAAYCFKWIGHWEIIDAGGGSYIRPNHEDWRHAVTLRKLAGIKNPEKY